MDYEQTALMYRNLSQSKKFETTPWYDKVKSKRTRDFYQAEDLIKRDMVPPDWQPPHLDSEGKPQIYPVKHVNSIIRVRTMDGKEWLKSRQMWYGLDQAGNQIAQSMDDKEMYDDTLPIYKLQPKDPRNRDSEMIREIRNIEHRIKYTELFNPETVQKLYDVRDGKCTLVLKDETSDGSPVQVISLDDFMNRPFEELWVYLHTPRQKSIEPSTTEEHLKQYG